MNKKDKESLPEVTITKHHSFSIVWVVPIIALAIAGWLAYRAIAMRGPEIEITFTDGSGLVAGKTEIQYLGVKVGSVDKVHLDEKLSKVVVRARLEKSAAGLATEDAAFWVVRPQIGFGGVRGLDTLLSGPYIGVAPGKGGKTVHQYVGLPDQPPAGPREPGLNLILQAEKLGSLSNGDPVYYREYQVGEVDQVYLASDARTVHAHVHIKDEFAPLVRENTKFWNASGIGMSLGLFGAKVKTESLSALFKGGIAFATPPNDEMGAEVADNTVFKLFDDPDDDWTEWSPTIDLPLVSEKLAKSVSVSGIPASKDATIATPAGTQDVKDESEPKRPFSPPGRHE
ncbi:intermembrane transport protein PqiB [Cerasicoccus maritimus]|uniref:PqiB family protein n=1 Tax=Cerasicoccus maritimus TaxID=490089 RepID=UPI0028525B2F|nr:MlaD family protein [Cerasicoccus maritimus]